MRRGPSPGNPAFISQELTIRIDKGKIKMVSISFDLTPNAGESYMGSMIPGRKSEI